ncbi:MAG TPA: EFR1 family ferrodoxin [Methanospirillum sp.]|uniref:EFR1 family ferrodoxin n=1 Tax=Methanospirillum sp. TaxID=45200 RepID=UPI002C6F7078|nr:EFR1 family ferrodoxin [Methanospirillum sp.]HWQ63416.1 EFR1 family ferrodoxin [Methanospirillum sp.]
MKTTLYYFTGTGNTLVVARNIAAILGDTDLVPIAALMKEKKNITTPEGRIGIFCPVYDMGIPVMVREFLQVFSISADSYLFAVLTLGGTGASALKMIDRAVKSHNGRGINAGFMVRMPGNFPPISVPPTGEKQRSILAKAEKDCNRIAEEIRNNRVVHPGMTPGSSLLQFILYEPFAKNVHNAGEKFSVSDACTSCGTCVSVCPSGNITLNDKLPVYADRCELCCACLNYCPVQAINLNMMFGTEGRGRYHHPAVTPADLRKQKELVHE